MRCLAAAVLVLVAVPAAGQAPDPVAGYVIDLRGATSGLPKETAFFPDIPTETLVPARGFGFDVGTHVYLFGLGPARVGAGANYIQVRGTTPGVALNLRTIAPQVSFSFGTAAGWSYVSAGLGRAWVRSIVDSEAGAQTAESSGLPATNIGGGARWFLKRHLGVGFDLRWHRITGPPKATLFAASVGFSVR